MAIRTTVAPSRRPLASITLIATFWAGVAEGHAFAQLPPRAAPEPGKATGRGYLVALGSTLAGSGYERAANELARFRRGEVWAWNGDWSALAARLRASPPANLALVLAPDAIDANLPRRLVPILAGLDDDPFVDCAWGVITGGTGEEALGFVQAIERADARAPAPRKFSATSVQVDRATRLERPREAGPEGRALDTVDLWLTGKDPQWRALLEAHRRDAQGCGLVEWGHCGDSQGIWLFSMYRNLDASKHWPYDPAKVGQDPLGEMPRLTPALLLEGVDLGGAVVINGSCHSGVTRRTIVGGDIVSTFGDTGGVVRFFDVTPEQSFALQAIRHGASAYLAPLAANHASRAAIEEWRIRAGGIPLGEVVRRSYDEMVLGATTLPLAFALFQDGEPDPQEPPMWTDVVHRVLFGDPAFVLWKEPILGPHRVTTEWVEPARKLRVDVRWEGLDQDPFVWDPWIQAQRGEPHERVYERVPLDADVAGLARVTIVKAETGAGASLELLKAEPKALLERDADGGAVLHVRARWPRLEAKDGKPALPKRVRFLFEVEFGPGGPGAAR